MWFVIPGLSSKSFFTAGNIAHHSPREVHGQSKLYRHIQYVEFNQFATGEVEAGQMNA